MDEQEGGDAEGAKNVSGMAPRGGDDGSISTSSTMDLSTALSRSRVAQLSLSGSSVSSMSSRVTEAADGKSEVTRSRSADNTHSASSKSQDRPQSKSEGSVNFATISTNKDGSNGKKESFSDTSHSQSSGSLLFLDETPRSSSTNSKTISRQRLLDLSSVSSLSAVLAPKTKNKRNGGSAPTRRKKKFKSGDDGGGAEEVEEDDEDEEALQRRLKELQCLAEYSTRIISIEVLFRTDVRGQVLRSLSEERVSQVEDYMENSIESVFSTPWRFVLSKVDSTKDFIRRAVLVDGGSRFHCLKRALKNLTEADKKHVIVARCTTVPEDMFVEFWRASKSLDEIPEGNEDDDDGSRPENIGSAGILLSQLLTLQILEHQYSMYSHQQKIHVTLLALNASITDVMKSKKPSLAKIDRFSKVFVAQRVVHEDFRWMIMVFFAEPLTLAACIQAAKSSRRVSLHNHLAESAVKASRVDDDKTSQVITRLLTSSLDVRQDLKNIHSPAKVRTSNETRLSAIIPQSKVIVTKVESTHVIQIDWIILIYTDELMPGELGSWVENVKLYTGLVVVHTEEGDFSRFTKMLSRESVSDAIQWQHYVRVNGQQRVAAIFSHNPLFLSDLRYMDCMEKKLKEEYQVSGGSILRPTTSPWRPAAAAASSSTNTAIGSSDAK